MKYCLAILFVLMFYELQAQHPTYVHYTDQDGLPSNEMYDIYQDKNGFMWFGSANGLARYDGQTFKHYRNTKQKGGALSHIQEDTQGRIWVQSFKGQLFYIENDSLHYFNPMDEFGEMIFYCYLVDESGNVWVHDSRATIFIYLKGEKRWHKVPLNQDELGTIRSILQYKGGKVYVLTESYLYTFTGTAFKAEGVQQLLGHIPEQMGQLSMGACLGINPRLAIWNEQLYLIKRNLGLSILSYKENRFNIWKEKAIAGLDLIKPNQINSVIEDANGLLWALTRKNGAIALWYTDSTKQLNQAFHLLPQGNVGDLHLDKEGNYWITTLGDGLYFFPNLDCKYYTTDNSILKESPTDLLCKVDENHIAWNGKEGKIYEYNVNTQKIDEYAIGEKGKADLLTSYKNHLVYVQDRNLFILTKKPSQKREETGYLKAAFNAKHSVFYNDSSMIVANGTSGWCEMNTLKSTHWHKLSWYTEFANHELFKSRRVSNNTTYWVERHSPTKAILFAQPDKVLTCIPNKEPYLLVDKNKHPINPQKMKAGLNGMLWITTQNDGIYGFDEKLELKYHWTKADGLISNVIREVAIDNANNLWFLASQGIQYWNSKTKEQHIYTLEDGLPTLDIKKMIIVDNKLWLSTVKGLVSFPLNMKATNVQKPPVFIEKIAIHDKDTVLKSHYNLEYDQNSLAIDVKGIAYKSQGNFQYKYRMLGIDTIWRWQANPFNTIRFPQLNPGEYTFEVKTVNEDGVESLEPARIAFSISLPYWETWWYQLLLYGGGFAVLFGVILFRVQQRRERERQQNHFNVLKMQALQSQMNPHFVFNVLAAVQNLWLQHKNEAALNMQSTFAKLLRKIFNYSSKAAILIEEEQEFLNNYLDLEQIRFEYQVEIYFEVDENLIEEEDRIAPLLIQPIIENSFKHGLFHKTGDRKLWIHLKREAPYLYCLIEDNGVGRSSKKKHKRSSGQNTTQERLNILQENIIKAPHPHNNFRITDLVDPKDTPIGTRAELWIPFV